MIIQTNIVLKNKKYIKTYSDSEFKIIDKNNIIYDSAYDINPKEYSETNIKIDKE